MRRVWDFGDVTVEEARISILQGLSRATLRRRSILCPLLNLAKQKGLTYRWGYPFAVTFHKESSAFNLQSTADLLALFRYFEMEPIPVPDWLQILPRVAGRSGVSAFRGPLPSHQQRGRCRCTVASGDVPRE